MSLEEDDQQQQQQQQGELQVRHDTTREFWADFDVFCRLFRFFSLFFILFYFFFMKMKNKW